jgi:hypothetical protein
MCNAAWPQWFSWALQVVLICNIQKYNHFEIMGDKRLLAETGEFFLIITQCLAHPLVREECGQR